MFLSRGVPLISGIARIGGIYSLVSHTLFNFTEEKGSGNTVYEFYQSNSIIIGDVTRLLKRNLSYRCFD